MKDVPLIVGVIVGLALAAAVVAQLIGRRVARRSRAGAILLSGLLPSIALVVVESLLFAHDTDVRGDGPAMALVGSLIYAVICLPFTLIIAAVVIRKATPR